eukprot:scaffold10570_cov176-Amphora_coffeaeformis.AAC.38
MDPGGILPRRSFTIRTENGVYRRVSQEEMQSLVRSRIQQARALASRRPREGWVLETPPALQIERQQANADSSGLSSDHYHSSWGGVPQRARTPSRQTAAFHQHNGEQDSLQESESRYDEAPLVQKHFSWSSVEEGRDDNEEEHDDAYFTERCSTSYNQESTIEVDDLALDIVELETEESEQVSGSSSDGELENQQEEEHHHHHRGQRPRLSPSHTTRPLPESPVYNNRAILDNFPSSRSRSASPKRSASTPTNSTAAPLSQKSNHAASTNSPQQSKKKTTIPKTSKQKRQEQRQAKVESLLRMSLSRVRDRARNELDQMLAREEEQPPDIQKSLSMTTRDIDQIVQETVRKAREAAEEELSELLKESLLRARESAEQEILNLVEASMSRVKSQVKDNKPPPDSSNPMGDNNVKENKEPLTGDQKVSVESSASMRPVFIETDHHQQDEHCGFTEVGGLEVGKEREETRNIFSTGTSQLPLLISESLEEAVEIRNQPWFPPETNGSVPSIQVKKRPDSQDEAEHFFPKPEQEEEARGWPYFEHSGSKTTSSTAWHEKAFPEESVARGNLQTDVKPNLGEATEESKQGVPWYGDFSAIQNDNVWLMDGFPVADKPADGFNDTPFGPSGWPAIPPNKKDNSITVWEEHHLALHTEQIDRMPDMTSDISLGSEPPRVEEESMESSYKTSVASPFVEDLNDRLTIPPTTSEGGNNKDNPPESAKLESYTASGAQSTTSYKNDTNTKFDRMKIEEVDDPDIAWLESLVSDNDIPFDESEAVKEAPRRELLSDQGTEVPVTGKVDKDEMHEKTFPDDRQNHVDEEKEDVLKRNGNHSEVEADHAQGLPVKDDVRSTNGSNLGKQNEVLVKEVSSGSQDIERGKEEETTPSEECGRQHGNSNTVKVSFREETSPIPPPEYESSESGDAAEESTGEKSCPYVVPNLDKEVVSFGKDTHELPTSRPDFTPTCPKPKETPDFETKAAIEALQSTLVPSPKLDAMTPDFNIETKNDIHKQNATVRHPALSTDETQDSKRPSIRQLDPHPAQTIISPLSVPTDYTSDEDGDKVPIHKFTASLRDTCSDGAPSPCRSLPIRQEVVGVFCTNILEAIHAESFETQTIVSLRTPSNQTFDAMSTDDDNSYLTSAVETWMESVAERIEGHTPRRAQRCRRRQRREEQQRKKDSEKASSAPKDIKELATEWLWALGEKLDLAVDHINEALGNGEQSESDHELEPLPLLSEIKRPSFSFSDGEGGGTNGLVGADGVANTEHPWSGSIVNKSAGKRSDRNKTKGSRKIAIREPTRQRRRQRGRSRVKREV